jgi:hypothetical protein
MAYVQDQQDPNAPQTAPTSGAAMNQLPQTSSGTGAGATSVNTTPGGSPQGAAAVPNSTQAPPVQNLGAYLAANQPQALQMGQNIANNLTTQGNQVSGDINADQAAVDQQVQAQNVQPNQDLINQAAANPTEFVQNPTNVTDFQNLENANYTGPTSFESTPQYQTLENEVTNAQQNAPAVNTDAGIQQLVTGQETNPTAGMENLDSLLLEGTPGATAPITAAEQPIQNLGTALQGATTTEDQNIAQAVANDQAAPEAVQAAFLTGPNAVVPQWETGLQNELTQADQGANAYNTDLQSYINFLNQNQPFNADLQASGLESSLGTGNPFTPAPPAATNAPTEANVATSQDYQTEAALQQLLGNALGTTPITQATANEAGTYALPGTVPANENIESIADQLATALGPTVNAQATQFGLPAATTPQAISQYAGLYGKPTATESAFDTLLQQIQELYPTSNYVQPITYQGKSIPNDYELVS